MSISDRLAALRREVSAQEDELLRLKIEADVIAGKLKAGRFRLAELNEQVGWEEARVAAVRGRFRVIG